MTFFGSLVVLGFSIPMCGYSEVQWMGGGFISCRRYQLVRGILMWGPVGWHGCRALPSQDKSLPQEKSLTGQWGQRHQRYQGYLTNIILHNQNSQLHLLRCYHSQNQRKKMYRLNLRLITEFLWYTEVDYLRLDVTASFLAAPSHPAPLCSGCEARWRTQTASRLWSSTPNSRERFTIWQNMCLYFKKKVVIKLNIRRMYRSKMRKCLKKVAAREADFKIGAADGGQHFTRVTNPNWHQWMQTFDCDEGYLLETESGYTTTMQCGCGQGGFLIQLMLIRLRVISFQLIFIHWKS